MTADFHHIPVLHDEVLHALAPADGEVFVDCTLGGGGHSEALLASSSCRVIGLDRDPAAIAAASARLARFGARFQAVRCSFDALDVALDELGVACIDGVLADLGVSSHQLDVAERGFSFRAAGPVDMRMNPDADLSAADIVNTWPEAEIARVIYEYGEERRSRGVARAIVAGRPWSNTAALADRVAAVVRGKNDRIHPATRTFQGLRIAVNDELGQVTRLLPAALSRLSPGGRLAIIAFHSLEDRIVKRFFYAEAGRTGERDAYGNPVRPVRLCDLHLVRPAPEDPNPRARSARLRTATRCP